MICKHCNSIVSEWESECSVCGRSLSNSGKGKDYLITVIRMSDLLIFLMTVLNGILVITASHYTLSTENGIFYEKMVVYYYYPTLRWMDLASEIALLIVLALSAASHYMMKRERRAGLRLMIGLHIFTLVWSIEYPILIYMITRIVSPILTFTVIQIAVYAVLAFLLSWYFIRSNRFHY